VVALAPMHAGRKVHVAPAGGAESDPSAALPATLEELPGSVAQFIGAGGAAGGNMRSASSSKSYFLSLLLHGDADSMQQNCIVVAELMAVLGGLLLGLTTVHDRTHAKLQNPGWDAEVSASDVIDGVNLLSMFAMLVACMLGFAAAVMCAGAGKGKGLKFYEGITDLLGFGMVLINVGVISSLVVVSFDHFKSMHPIVATVSVVGGAVMYGRFSYLIAVKVFLEAMPLETFHLPFALRAQVTGMAPFGAASKGLEAAANAAATKLRAELGY